MGNLRIFLLRKSFSCIAKKVDNYLLSGQPFMFFTNKSMNIRLILQKNIWSKVLVVLYYLNMVFGSKLNAYKHFDLLNFHRLQHSGFSSTGLLESFGTRLQIFMSKLFSNWLLIVLSTFMVSSEPWIYCKSSLNHLKEAKEDQSKCNYGIKSTFSQLFRFLSVLSIRMWQ